MKEMMKKIEVMMVKKEEIGGKEVKVIKMVEMNEDAMKYVELGSSDKVKEVIKGKIKESKVFGLYDVDDLWYKWDEFMRTWRKERMKLMRERKKEMSELEVE